MLPKLYDIPPQSSINIDSFGGINVLHSKKEGELENCCNIEFKSYPAISSREKRKLHSICDGKINGTGSFDGFFYTYCSEAADNIYLNFAGVDYKFTSYSESKDFTAKRRFACLEKCIMILPDKVVFYTETKSFKKINVNQIYTNTSISSKFYAEGLGTNVFDYNLTNRRGMITANSISSYAYNYKYGGTARVFYSIAFDSNLKAGDVVKIKASVYVPSVDNNPTYRAYVEKMASGFTAKIKSISRTSHPAPAGTITETISLNFDNNTIETGGYYEIYFTDITIERIMPELDRITAFNNRVWGISGGKVYASKLGDPIEWNDFSADSYGVLPSSCFSASAGTDGKFTGIIPHGNYVYALKENFIHRIYGDTPDEYTISNLEAPGVLKDTDTLSVCGIYLMYASSNGVCILRDGYPKIISQKIGDINPICAASCNGKYYILCSKESGRVIYVYDIQNDVWTMQSCAPDADNLCFSSGKICYSEGGALIYLSGDDGDEYEKDVHWMFRIRFDRNNFSKNTALRAVARIALEKNASYTVRAFYDDDTRGAICGMCYDETGHGYSLMQLPVKKDLGFYLEFKGVGGFTIRGIKFNYYKGKEE